MHMHAHTCTHTYRHTHVYTQARTLRHTHPAGLQLGVSEAGALLGCCLVSDDRLRSLEELVQGCFLLRVIFQYVCSASDKRV